MFNDDYVNVYLIYYFLSNKVNFLHLPIYFLPVFVHHTPPPQPSNLFLDKEWAKEKIQTILGLLEK